MSTKVEIFPRFKRELKRLGKKFRSLLDEVDELIDDLEDNPN